MNDLTLVQQYLLCAVSDGGKLTSLHSERMICFLAGGLLTLELAGCVAVDEKKKISATAPLPEGLAYLRPMYDFIVKKGPVAAEKVAERTVEPVFTCRTRSPKASRVLPWGTATPFSARAAAISALAAWRRVSSEDTLIARLLKWRPGLPRCRR